MTESVKMKSPEVVDAIMQAIPEKWRKRWCGGERGACACMGCVQVGNRAVIAEKIAGEKFPGDPEYLSEVKLQAHGAVYADNKVTRAEWEAWSLRQAAAPQADESRDSCVVMVGTGKSTISASAIGAALREAGELGGKNYTMESPIECQFKLAAKDGKPI